MTAGFDGSDFPPAGSLLFVYGTLQRGGEFHHLLSHAGTEFIGSGKTATKYPLLLDEYPCLIDQPGRGHNVTGEVYRIAEPKQWHSVDRLEGHPEEYRRRIETIHLESGTVKAHAYFYLHPDLLRKGLVPVSRFSVE